MLPDDLYAHCREYLELTWLPSTATKLRAKLDSLVAKSTPTETEGHCLFQCGTAFMCGLRLIDTPEFVPPAPHFTQTAALQLILYGTYFQLRESMSAPEFTTTSEFSDKVEAYLESAHLRELRHALAHQMGDDALTWWYFDAESQSAKFSTRGIRRDHSIQSEVPLKEILMATNLQWSLYTSGYQIPSDT